MSRTAFAVACLACLTAGYLASCVPGFTPVNPFHPKPQRPVVRFISRLAKLGLWLTVFADPPPPASRREYRDAGGVCHMEGW